MEEVCRFRRSQPRREGRLWMKAWDHKELEVSRAKEGDCSGHGEQGAGGESPEKRWFRSLRGGHCSERCRWQEGEPVRGSRCVFLRRNYIVGKVEAELITEGRVGPGDQKEKEEEPGSASEMGDRAQIQT